MPIIIDIYIIKNDNNRHLVASKNREASRDFYRNLHPKVMRS